MAPSASEDEVPKRVEEGKIHPMHTNTHIQTPTFNHTFFLLLFQPSFIDSNNEAFKSAATMPRYTQVGAVVGAFIHLFL